MGSVAEANAGNQYEGNGTNGRPVIIGICGGSGSGKTTLAQRLVDRLGPSHARSISFDCYYRDFAHWTVEQRAAVNFDHPDSLDHELLLEHLGRLRANTAVAVPGYDFANHTRSGDLTLVEPTRFVIIEGILLFAFAEVRELLDYRIFRRVGTDLRAERRMARDVVERGRSAESVVRQWRETVQPMHERFVEPFASHADLITTSDQELDEVVDDLCQALRSGQPLAANTS